MLMVIYYFKFNVQENLINHVHVCIHHDCRKRKRKIKINIVHFNETFIILLLNHFDDGC